VKTLIVIEDHRTQLVLQPESEHDQAALSILEKLPNTHRVEFYQTQGGWTTRRAIYGDPMYGQPDKQPDLVIVFDDPVTPPAPSRS